MTSPSPLSPWRAAELVQRSEETLRGANLVFAVDGWPGHRAGQHVDLRLTGADGCQAQRSYSIASAPLRGLVTLAVERLERSDPTLEISRVITEPRGRTERFGATGEAAALRAA